MAEGADGDGSAPPQSGRRTTWAVTSISLGTLLNPLNSSMIAVALFDLQKTFTLGIAQATWVGLTPLGARWIETRGLRFTLIVGGLGLIVGTALLAVAAFTINPVAILIITAAMGAPYCVVSIAMNQALYASAAPKDAGVAAGIFQTSRYVGAIIATTLLGIVFVDGSGPDAAPQWITIVAIATGLAVVHAVLLAAWHPRAYREPSAVVRG